MPSISAVCALTALLCGCGLGSVGPDLDQPLDADLPDATGDDAGEQDAALEDGAQLGDDAQDVGSGADSLVGADTADTAASDAGAKDAGVDAAQDTATADAGCVDASACAGAAGLCRKWACLAGACTPTADDGASCSDGDACSVDDACKAGQCAAGLPRACTDSDACTADSCDTSKGCVFAVTAGAACDDKDPCRAGDTCDAVGVCAGVTDTDCDDANVCTIDACKPGVGCETQPAPAASPCTDGDACTAQDGCKSGVCVAPMPLVCADGNGCTGDSCASATGCAFLPLTATACTDNDLCTAGDTCSAGVCKPAKNVDCDDKNPCTTDTCAAQTGCKATPLNGAECSDDSACTTIDTCKQGKCVGQSGLYETKWPAPKGTLRLLAAVLPDFGMTYGFIADLTPGAVSATTGTIGGFNAAGVLVWQQALKAPFGARRMRMTNGGAVAVGTTVQPAKPYLVVVTNKTGAAPTVTLETTLDDANLEPNDVDQAVGGWMVVGARGAANKHSSGFAALVGFDGKHSAPRLHSRGYSSELRAVTSSQAGTPFAACGSLTWSPLGHRDAWFVALSADGSAVSERTWSFARRDSCWDLIAVGKDFVLVGSGEASDYLKSGMVWRADGVGRVKWTQPITGDFGGEALRVWGGDIGELVVGATVRDTVANSKTVRTQPMVLRLNEAAGDIVWSRKLLTDRPTEEVDFGYATAHMTVFASTIDANGAPEPVLARVNMYGVTDCEKAGKCANFGASMCEDVDDCTDVQCDPTKGCINVPRAGFCDDATPCTATARCSAGKCQTGAPRMWNVGHGPATAGHQLVSDLRGGWLTMAERGTKGGVLRVADDGSKIAEGLDTPNTALALRRMGSRVEVVDGKGKLRLLTLDGLSPAPSFSISTVADAPHEPQTKGALRVAFDGERAGSIGTVTKGGTQVISVSLGVLELVEKAAAYLFVEKATGTLAPPAVGTMRSVELAARPVGGWYVLADWDPQAASGSPTGARLMRVDDQAKLQSGSSWTNDKTGEQLRALALLAARNGDAVIALEHRITGGTTVIVRRITAAGKDLWTHTAPAANVKDGSAALVELHRGAVVGAYVGASGATDVAALLRIDSAGGSMTSMTVPIAGADPRPYALGLAPNGGVAAGFVTDMGLHLFVTDSWLSESCQKAGICDNQTDVSCDDGNTCTMMGCEQSFGCQPSNLADGTACGGDDACLLGAQCSGGTCQGGKQKACNDGVACTVDACVAATGACEAHASDDACYTANTCTTDSCTATGCKSTAVTDGTACGGGKTCKSGVCQ